MKVIDRLASLTRAVACVVLVSGCSTPRVPAPPYVAPTSGPTARLIVRGTLPAGDRYGVFVLAKGEACADPHLVGVGDAQRHPDATTLATDSAQTVEFRVVTAEQKTCRLRWTFTPVSGKTYLLRGNGQATTCSALVLDMTDADHMRPEPSAVRRNPSGNTCVSIALSKPISGLAANDANPGEDAVLRQSAGSSELDGLIGK